MKIIHLSYARVRHYSDPEKWLEKINYYACLLTEMGVVADVKSIHCINYDGLLTMNNVEYHFLKQNKLQIIAPFRLNEYVKKLEPELVLIHGLHFPIQLLLLRWKLGPSVKIVAQNHAERPLRHYKKILQRLADNYVSAYFFTSIHQAKHWLQEGLIRDEKKIVEIMEVPSVFSPMDRVNALTKTQVIGLKNYLWVGRLESNKDPITLIKAFIIFAKSNPGVHLYVVFQSDELIEKVKCLISQAAESSLQISLIGKVEHEELIYWYNSCDFIISSSRYEGSGIAVCEGMSCGCVPILTNIPSFSMMTDHGTCGLLFNAGDIESLNQALQKSLTLDIEKEREKVIKQYEENLSAHAIAKKMIDVFKNI